MTLVENNSEDQVVGLGIFVIALNLGMYIVVPVIGILTISKHLKSRKI